MKSSISIVSYLLKDICWRWLEQPGNLLTRFLVTFVLVLPALGLLGVFVLMGDSLEAKLRRDGIDTLFVTEMVDSASDESATSQVHPRLAGLSRHGRLFQLLQLYAVASVPPSKVIRIAAYPDSALPALAGMIRADSPVLYVSETLPEGMPVEVELDEYPFAARVVRPTDMVAKFFQDEAILLPEGMLPRLESKGYSRISLFKASRLEDLPPLESSLRLCSDIEKARWFIRSSISLLQELTTLKARQYRWRSILAATSGGILALVLGTLAVLEYHQRSYVIALLRSFGVSRMVVYAMQWVENAVVVNLAALAAVFCLLQIQSVLYASFNLGGADSSLSGLRLQSELILIFACLNLGVFLSTLPTLPVLRKDIGTILS